MEREDIHGTCDGTDRSGYEFPIFEYCHPNYFSGAEEAPLTGGENICGDRRLVGNGAIGEGSGCLFYSMLITSSSLPLSCCWEQQV